MPNITHHQGIAVGGPGVSDLDEIKLRHKQIPITAAPTGAEQDTGYDLPAKSVLVAVFVDVTTAEVTGGTKTLDVGLLSSESGGSTNGFLVAAPVSATGIKKGSLVGTDTLG